ncbi:MAG: hypothetical protein JST16_02015 [Bdellovibrionales bacterium]|nr:hypothetical protein [Bdellovibrionales bacterium]
MKNSLRGFTVICLSLKTFLLAQAHTPEIGQVIRYQANVLRNSKPFTVKGQAIVGKHHIETLLEWHAPGTYRLVLKDIPADLYAAGETNSSWTLMRSGRRCVIKTDSMTAACPSSGFWGAAQLSGLPDEAVAALVSAGFVAESDSAYKETDGRTNGSEQKNIRVVVGANGKTPAAVLEIRGPRTSTTADNEEYPLVQYDQTFLSLLLARFEREGEVTTIQALSDLNIVTRKNRFSPVIANRLEIFSGKTLKLVFQRNDPTPAKTLPPFQLPKALVDVSSLKSHLSVQGQDFLNYLLLTH